MKYYFAIVILTLFSLNAHAGLSKWVDSEGVVHYSDTIPPEVTTAKPVHNIAGKDQANAPASNASKSLAEREAEMKKAKQEREDAAQKKAKQETTAATKQNNCDIARQNVRALEDGARIADYDANGERTFLSDDARAQRLEEARKSVRENCN